MTQVRAQQSFRANGVIVRRGDVFEDSDPIVDGRGNLFRPVGETVRTTAADVAPAKRARKTKPAAASEGDGE